MNVCLTVYRRKARSSFDTLKHSFAADTSAVDWSYCKVINKCHSYKISTELRSAMHYKLVQNNLCVGKSCFAHHIQQKASRVEYIVNIDIYINRILSVLQILKVHCRNIARNFVIYFIFIHEWGEKESTSTSFMHTKWKSHSNINVEGEACGQPRSVPQEHAFSYVSYLRMYSRRF